MDSKTYNKLLDNKKIADLQILRKNLWCQWEDGKGVGQYKGRRLNGTIY